MFNKLPDKQYSQQKAAHIGCKIKKITTPPHCNIVLYYLCDNAVSSTSYNGKRKNHPFYYIGFTLFVKSYIQQNRKNKKYAKVNEFIQIRDVKQVRLW